MRPASLPPATLFLPLLGAACSGASPEPAGPPPPVLIAPPPKAAGTENGPEATNEPAAPAAEAAPSPPDKVETAPPPSPWLAGPAGVLGADASRLSLRIDFQLGTDRFRPESASVLDATATNLQSMPSITLVRIEGHTDGLGDSAHNMALSKARALAVAKALVGRGVDCVRLIPVGFGETKPAAPNDTEQNRARNRRIELVVAAQKGRPVGGMPVDGGGMVAGDPCR